MKLSERIKPFHDKHVTYNIPEDSRQLVSALGLKPTEDGTLPLYFFDWKSLDADTKEAIREKSGQDDYTFFAVINGTGANLAEQLASKHRGFLMYAADRPDSRIYLGDGGMDTFTKEVAAFFENLAT